MTNLLSDGTKQLTLSRAQFADISAVLEQICIKTKCSGVIVIDPSGLVISHAGEMNSANFAGLSALAAANYAATAEMARLLGEPNGFRTQFHQGQNNSLYLTGVNERFVIIVIFPSSTTFGMVRVVTEKLVPQLDEIFQRIDKFDASDVNQLTTQQDVGSDEFCDELSDRLDSILGPSGNT